MNIVWIVTEGAYDAFRVDSVWTTEVAANERVAVIVARGGYWADRAQAVQVTTDMVLADVESAAGTSIGSW